MKCIEIYKKQLEIGDIQLAYVALTSYIGELRASFPKEYKVGNISFGYLDYTYFPFVNDYLKSGKLRFGIVLNHERMQIELWLMGQNAELQGKYWNLLKNSKWNKNLKEMPKYSVLEVVLEDEINLNNKDEMTQIINENALKFAKEIQKYIEDKKK